jgi:hypothetical protein
LTLDDDFIRESLALVDTSRSTLRVGRELDPRRRKPGLPTHRRRQWHRVYFNVILAWRERNSGATGKPMENGVESFNVSVVLRPRPGALGFVDTFRTICLDPTAEFRSLCDMVRASGLGWER